ncbi:16S rRNA (adenine(1518)-N(6)/adenine(1519)-N(6))-dimethyltransferase RsmA [Mycoplasma elephantis]|uniref:16S rRNA (adenine(1518)-N(6)/adenine(1519)-N(6))- dimethyltransferase RsmA n=1 Tax=Mycoplasma elephantis TaxID=114882 RepID=UPI000481BBDA|nr:16S rRNA (adenine(1518)-N(6)/adenine(1519)-N(6))-dimethyltransferase RsmA [Mycoplasma elephantis]
MNNIIPKKKFGQNFLIDENIKNKIIEAANITNEDIVVEIGPGTGAITKKLIKKAKKVISYEVDKELVSLLKNQISSNNFELVEGDFLKKELPNYDIKIVANIPYNITSDILFKLFENHKNIKEAIIMMQKEVLDRILAYPNTSNYSKLSISTKIFANVEKLFDVKPSSFSPSPKVISSVAKFIFKNDVYYDYENLLKFISICFQFRRKILIKNLISKYEKELLTLVFKKMNLSLNCRAQELSLDTLIELYELLK